MGRVLCGAVEPTKNTRKSTRYPSSRYRPHYQLRTTNQSREIATRQLKNGKAPGPGEILADVLKIDPVALIEKKSYNLFGKI